MTEDELVKEIKRRTEIAHAYHEQLAPVVSQMFQDQKDIFNEGVTAPANLKSTDIHSIRFASTNHWYSLSHSHGYLRIVRSDPLTDKQEILLGWSDHGIDGFIDGDWPEDIIRFAAVLHESSEPARILQKQQRELEHQKLLHRQAQALGIPSPYNFPEKPVMETQPKQSQADSLKEPVNLYPIIAALIVVIFVIYFIARMY